MSTFSCPVVQIQGYGMNPNADNLCIAQVEGTAVQFRKGDFEKGGIAIYIPVDAMVPLDHPAFEFLKDPDRPNKTHYRMKAKKLRGVFSAGMLIKLDSVNTVLPMHLPLGTDLSSYLGIKKYEEPEDVVLGGDNIRDPGVIRTYTDIEPYRKYKHILVPGEQVVISEKLHGCNARYCFFDEQFFVGSHNKVKDETGSNVWSRVGRDYNLKAILAKYPGCVLFGEVLNVQDLNYGIPKGGVGFRVFDLYDPNLGMYRNHTDVVAFCHEEGLQHVPVLYAGPYDPTIVEEFLTASKSTLADHIMEGTVIKTDPERWNPETHRTIFKQLSEAYLLRKGGTEHH